MKKMLAVALMVLFTSAVLSPAVFAECAGKSHGGTKTTDSTTQPKPTSA